MPPAPVDEISFLSLLDNSPDLFYRTDLEGRITFISPSVLELSGYTVDEAIGMHMAQEVYLEPAERDAFVETLRRDGRVRCFQARLVRKDGSVWWAQTSAHFLRGPDGDVVGVEGVTRDISELKETEERLRVAEERFRLAFHTSPDAINLNRARDGVYIDVNRGFTDLTGYTREDVLGRSSLEIQIWQDPADRERLVAGLGATGHVANLEATYVRKDGTTLTGLMSARVLSIGGEDVILSVTRDITDRVEAEAAAARLERQLAQAQKLEAIGRLAGGVAHDINNQLMPILGFAELLLEDTGREGEAREPLEQIVRAARGARDLVSQLLAFSRKQRLEYRPVDVNGTLRAFEPLLARTLREDIRIALHLSDELPLVMADAGQLEQVVMNLAVNAADAMPDGGRLEFATEVREVGTDDPPADLTPGPYVTIRTTDDGHGMDEATRAQIFEPFFSTKGELGTGLGLATVYGIVKQHGGDILVESEPGAGTSFTVFLPVTRKATREEPDAPAGGVMPRGHETVLVVEDNHQVRHIVARILERSGYSVVAASCGDDARREAALRPFDLLVTDVVMPDVDGPELHEELSRDRASLPVVFMSGYPDDGLGQARLSRVGGRLLQKPFTSEAILRAVRAALDGA